MRSCASPALATSSRRWADLVRLSSGRPVVSLFEFSACGVSLAWSLPVAQTVALKAIVDVVARFRDIPLTAQIQLEPHFDPADAITAADLEHFATAAQALVRPDRAYNPNKLKINGEDSGFTIVHLDQSTAGLACVLAGPCSDEARDRFHDTAMKVLREYEAANVDVEFDFGAYS
jgi:hypothetical protein